ncbi:MAG TPA: hypothetical protein DCS63_11155 [Elusimicrobia bacterium]|nr:hypothetical protein [Elusimicrobiota bacterium]
MNAEAQAYVFPFPKASNPLGRPFAVSAAAHLLLLLFFVFMASQLADQPLPQIKVMEINVIGKEDLALKGTGSDFARGPLPDKELLAQPAKGSGNVVRGNTAKLSKSMHTEAAPIPAEIPVLKSRGPLFAARGSIASAGVGREKIYVSAKTMKASYQSESKGGEGEGLVGVSGAAIDLSAKRGSGGSGGTGNYLSGGEGSVNGGNTLSRRGAPILSGYGVSNDQVLQASKRRPAELSAPSDDFFSISGPLRGRKIIKMSLPRYPRWAEEQGLEAQVSVRITVTAAGKVKPNMLIEQTSGFPEFDKVVMEAVSRMVFVPLPYEAGNREEWGVTSFNFKLKKRSA